MVSLHSISEPSPFPRVQNSRLPRDDTLGYSYMPQRGRYEAVSGKLKTFLSICQCHVCNEFRPDELLPLPSHYPSTGFACLSTSVEGCCSRYMLQFASWSKRLKRDKSTDSGNRRLLGSIHDCYVPSK